MTSPLHLFQAYGVELEYMIVERTSLRVLPVCDRLLAAAAAQPGAEAEFEDGSDVPTEVALGPVSWSNELVAHVVEFKTTDPAPDHAPLAALFQQNVALANRLLAPLDAMLLPTAMHPLMDPFKEMHLWSHGYSDVYRAFNRIFDCRGHGWANLQATHLNLPFCGDREFGRLHGALRALLPLLPALAASSPARDAQLSGLLDTRMDVYRTNSRRVPSIAGLIVPEPVFTEADYRSRILQRIYDDLAPLDPEGTLRDEWCNSRGCIARFSRSSIEVRVLDIQECPAADLAIIAAIAAAARALTTGALGSLDRLAALDTAALHRVFLEVIRDAENAAIGDTAYLDALGVDRAGANPTAGAVWRSLIDQTLHTATPGTAAALETILARGTLARRIVRALGPTPAESDFVRVYRELASCLADGRMFEPATARR